MTSHTYLFKNICHICFFICTNKSFFQFIETDVVSMAGPTETKNFMFPPFSLIKKIFSFTWVIDQGESRLLTKLVNL